MRVSTRCRIPFVLAIAIALVMAGCSTDSSSRDEPAVESSPEYASDATDADNESASEPAAEDSSAEEREEHAPSEGGDEHRESGEHAEGGEHGETGEHDGGGEGEGEESGVYVGTRETWDNVRRGVRLVLRFYPDRGVFFGSVENATEAMLCDVRVEVHLDSGVELGPTESTDLESGQRLEVALPTDGAAFETWTAHPEVSSCAG